MRRHSATQRGASSPTMSSGERGTHSSEWEGTPPLRRERHAHRWPSGWGEQCWLYQQRALGSGTLIPRNEWTFRRSEGSGILIGNPLMRGVMLALPITSSGEWRTHSSEWEGTQTLSRERHAQRWPSNEGSNASSTYNELWRVENSFLRMKRHSAAQKGAAYS